MQAPRAGKMTCFCKNDFFGGEPLGHHLGHPELMNSRISKLASIWDTKMNLPGRSKNGLRERLANDGSCGARHAHNIGPPFFSGQNELASHASKTHFFAELVFVPTSPRIIQANLSSKLRSHAGETHIVFSHVRLVYVKPSFMCESEFAAQS